MAARVAPDHVAMPGAPSTPGAPHAARRSGSLRLTMLLLAFAVAPLILYGWLSAADADKRAIVLGTAQDQVNLIAASLRPLLDRDDPSAVARIDAAVRAHAVDGRTLRVIRAKPASGNETDFLVASYPMASAAEFAAIRGKLLDAERTGLDRQNCNGSRAIEARVGDAEILAAAALVATPGSCWTILIGWSSAPFLASSLGRPYWQTREFGVAAAAYLAFIAIVLTILIGKMRKQRAANPFVIPVYPTIPASVPEPVKLPTAHALERHPPPVELDLGAPLAEILDLRKHVADLVFQYHEDVTARGLSFSYEAVQPAAIRGTRSLIDGALINLLDTALAASRPGDVVRVIVRTDDGIARLIVEDGGHAIAHAAEPESDQIEIRHAIWVAHRNVEAMGGKLEVERQANGVSRFVASFPPAG